ncbi:MAG TPA: hypothetical protein VKB50_06010 [Vicinamibacterales bacterium]|nr:hypothetical protein [Vicinamibacterales bacterium]
MADQNPQHGRRPHFHRGRRGPDRRGNDRRNPPPQDQQQPTRDHVDVEQIMREIRSRISQRHGIDLTTQQIQELAARRLEAILDPRTVKPSLLEQLRRSASSPIEPRPVDASLSYAFEATTLYESPNGFVRFMRRLLQPLLKLFFNPNPLIQAMNTQARINEAALAREAERDRRQMEWNALHYDILQRLVTEVSRTSLEGQGLSMRVESLAAKVDFNERRVRGVENTLHQARPAPRQTETAFTQPPAAPPREGGMVAAEAPSTEPGRESPREGGTPEGGRRRRRRRRGRRPQLGAPFEGSAQPPQGVVDQIAGPPSADDVVDSEPDIDEEDEESTAAEAAPEEPTLESAPPSADVESTVPGRTTPEPAFAFDPFAPDPTPAPVHVPSNPENGSPEPSVAPAVPDQAESTEPRDPSDSGQ